MEGSSSLIRRRAYGPSIPVALSSSIWSCRPQPHVQPCALGQGDKRIQAEALGALLAQIHGARMRDAQLFGDLIVAQAFGFEARGDGPDQFAAQAQVQGN